MLKYHYTRVQSLQKPQTRWVLAFMAFSLLSNINFEIQTPGWQIALTTKTNSIAELVKFFDQ